VSVTVYESLPHLFGRNFAHKIGCITVCGNPPAKYLSEASWLMSWRF